MNIFQNLFRHFYLKKMARHLRKPRGAFGIQIGSMMNKTNESLYEFTFGIMQPGYYESILEIGFGNGKFFENLASRAEGLSISGIDYSETMLKEAESKNEQLIRDGKLKLQTCNSDHLPFADNSFDKIFCINVIYFWNEPGKHLKEIYRTLKPGGKFYATVRSKESLQQMPFTRFGFKGYTEDEWERLVNRHNLTRVEVSKLDEPAVEFQGRSLQFQSLCFVVKK